MPVETQQTAHQICERLVADFGFRLEGEYLRGGRCPACQAPEAYVVTSNPWAVICPRENKCGVKTAVRTLYPEFFQAQKAQSSTPGKDPLGAAKAYLASRGLDPERFEGWFEQGERSVLVDGQYCKIATVRFPLSANAACHRLIGHTGKDKTRFEGKYSGMVWMPPDLELSGDVWVTEGILDAFSLHQAGARAISTISASHIPKTWLSEQVGKSLRLIIAYDNDPAGHRGSGRLAQACRERGLDHLQVFPPTKKDWNDLLAAGDLSAENLTEKIEDAASDHKAVQCKRRLGPEIWEENGQYLKTDVSRQGVERDVPLTNFRLRLAYDIRVRTPEEDSLEYAFLFSRNGDWEGPYIAQPPQLATPQAFQAFLSKFVRGALLNVNRADFTALMEHTLGAEVPRIKRLDFLGYGSDSEC